ncbi:hypothetical protein JM658_16455 [Joostella atrarenae]|uniref:DUF4241 domain-containing protein n=1 Tax=Joostella atrarenae TaxID=679257 RepID=A0ABS9J7L8_9FLAO|nr:hypothetical protein [Joostella atrarenae]MCF8716421.1 hypothetical protein [Joostella atrarenae]
MGIFDFFKKNKKTEHKTNNNLKDSETAKLVDSEVETKTENKLNTEKVTPKNHIELFPDIESIFKENLDKNAEVFFPVCSIDLGVINKEWKNEKIHLIQFHEDPYNTETAKYFNDYCKDNMISFSLENGKYKFNTDFGYFDLTDDWKEYYEETKISYNKSKTEFKENGKSFNLENLIIGGEPEWWQSDETPLDPDGNPMTFITELETYGFCPDSCDKKIFMFYSHKHKLVVELYQIT